MKRVLLMWLAAVFAGLGGYSADQSLDQKPGAIAKSGGASLNDSKEPGLLGYWKLQGVVLDLYDPSRRRGITLSVNSSASGYQGQGSDRHVYFGIDSARRKRSQKRDQGGPRVELNESQTAQQSSSDELVAIHESLDRLAHEDAGAADLVKLRYFAGMTMPEAAIALAIPGRTAERLWAYARAWLRREIRRNG